MRVGRPIRRVCFQAIIVICLGAWLAAAAHAQTDGSSPAGENPVSPTSSAQIASALDAAASDKDTLDLFKGTSEERFRSLDNECFGCEIFDLTASVGMDTADRVAARLRAPMAIILATFALVYVLFKVGAGLIVGDASDLASRMMASYRFLIIVAVASAFLGLNGAASGSGGQAGSGLFSTFAAPVFAIPLIATNEINAVGSGGAERTCGPSRHRSPPELADMRKVICALHHRTAEGMAAGWGIATNGGLLDFARPIVGFALFGIYFWIMLTFPYRFLDATIRLCAILMLSPIFILCVAFPQTRQYTALAVKQLLYVALLMLFMSFMFLIAAGMLGSVANIKDGVFVDEGMTFMGYVKLFGVGLIVNALIAQGPEIAKDFAQTAISTGAGDRAMQAAGAAAGAGAKIGGAAAVVASGGLVGGAAGAKRAVSFLAQAATRGIGVGGGDRK